MILPLIRQENDAGSNSNLLGSTMAIDAPVVVVYVPSHLVGAVEVLV